MVSVQKFYGGSDSVITIRTPQDDKQGEIREWGFPINLTVQFVSVVLDSGDTEVLVTSLLAETAYSRMDFKILYYLRWGVENVYFILKTRLTLEKFTGETNVK
ncbi:MAG: hypothetical protein HQM12_17115 [SAR324 cluster bacterium]|nr:hypothetical protein [SAR324 cluster bacterium]